MNEDRIYQLLRLEAVSKLSTEESEELDAIRMSQADDVKAIELLLKASHNLDYPTEAIIDEGWRSIEHKLVDEATVIDTRKKSPMPMFLMGVAASVLIVAAIYYALPSPTVQYEASKHKIEIELTDGSDLALNAASKVIPAENYGEDARKMAITGEVYIDAEKDLKPMVVKSDNFSIQVIGTRFNVMDYPTDDICTITLYEGEVALTLSDGKQVQMKAGDHICWNKRLKTLSQSRTSHLMPSWLSGRLAFDNVLFDEVFTRMERMYNISIEEKSLLKGLHFTYDSEEQNLEHIIDQIQLSSGMIFKKTGGTTYRIEPKG